MPHHGVTKTTDLLVGGDLLTCIHSRDAHGSAMTAWEHEKDGQCLRYWTGHQRDEDLLSRRVSFVRDIISERGFLAFLPDGREIKHSDVSFPKDADGLVKHSLSYLLFASAAEGVRLLKNEAVVALRARRHPEEARPMESR